MKSWQAAESAMALSSVTRLPLHTLAMERFAYTTAAASWYTPACFSDGSRVLVSTGAGRQVSGRLCC